MFDTRRILTSGWSAPVLALLLNLHPLPLQGQGGGHQWRQVHLGVEVTITAHGDPDAVEAAATAAFETIAELEAILSDWRPHSELRQLTERPTGEWHPVSPQLAAVLELALRFAAASDGAFDPTIGALTQLWRQQRRTGAAPDSATLAAARRAVNWHAVELDAASDRIRWHQGGIRFDLGGIAKGWILDRALATMQHHGVNSAMIEAGGDLVTGDAPPGTNGWRIAIAGGDTVVSLHNTALATSGPSLQFVIDPDSTRRSHVIDPVSGRGLGNFVEVTVGASSGGVADAVATTLTLLPEDKWPAILEQFDATLLAATGRDN